MLTNLMIMGTNFLNNETNNGKGELGSLTDMTKPVETLVEQLTGPVIGIVSTLAVIYCVFLGVKLAKADEPQEKEKAKGALKTAIIGYLLIFVLIMMIRIVSPTLAEWVK